MRREEDGHRHRLVDVFRAATAKKFRSSIVTTSRTASAATRFHRSNLGDQSDPQPRGPDGTGNGPVSLARRGRPPAMPSCVNCWAIGGRRTAPRSPLGRDCPGRQPEDEHAAEARVAPQLFVMQVIQPGLVGLMDGSVSTLAPLFAAAFPRRNRGRRSWWAWLPRWARPSAWRLPKPSPTTAALPGDVPTFAAWSAVS